MNKLTELFQGRPAPAEYARRYLQYAQELLGSVDHAQVAAFIDALLETRARGKRIYFIGNGGSAATASHFANDLAIGTRSWTCPFRVMSLTDNVALLSALANDYGYDGIFAAQLRVLMEAGDLVVAISVSGNSPNILTAVEWAKANGAGTIGLTGFDGGKLRQMVDIVVHVPTRTGEYGPVEDVHMIFDHLVATYLRALCESEREVGS